MPTISLFYAIEITMNYNEHSPPHFHAAYQGQQAQVNIGTLEIIEGRLPPRALALVLEWAALHRAELRQAWELASLNRPPARIQPLE